MKFQRSTSSFLTTVHAIRLREEKSFFSSDSSSSLKVDSSVVSTHRGRTFYSSAMHNNSLRMTVSPTPHNLVISMLCVDRPLRTRLIMTHAFSSSSPRPASSGGGVPVPGENGFCAESIIYIPSNSKSYQYYQLLRITWDEYSIL